MVCSFILFIYIYCPSILLRSLTLGLETSSGVGILTHKICTVSWNQVCRSYDACGLKLRSVSNINDSIMLHLCWNFMSINEHWEVMCTFQYLNDGDRIHYYRKSPIWYGIKWYFDIIKQNMIWSTGNENNIYYWKDDLLRVPLMELLYNPRNAHHLLNSKVSDLLDNYVWRIPNIIVEHYPDVAYSISKVIIPRQPLEDRLVWKHSKDGHISSKQAC